MDATLVLRPCTRWIRGRYGFDRKDAVLRVSTGGRSKELIDGSKTAVWVVKMLRINGESVVVGGGGGGSGGGALADLGAGGNAEIGSRG